EGRRRAAAAPMAAEPQRLKHSALRQLDGLLLLLQRSLCYLHVTSYHLCNEPASKSFKQTA
ncbi:hypothetical protein NDU88_002786, partial [Pleurodeles waltl]